MKKAVVLLGVILLSGFAMTSFSLAQHGHGPGAGSKMETREVLVEGVKVTFQIMSNTEHRKALKEMKMKDDVEPGTTHNVTVVLQDEKSLKEIMDAQVQMKVVDPKGKDQIKSLKFEASMKSYDAYFNLPSKGKYQVMTLFQVGERKRTAGIHYEIK